MATSSTSQVIIAGATGLVGSCVLKQLLAEAVIDGVYALTRKPLKAHTKLTELLSAELTVKNWDNHHVAPEFGVIALGTTRKQAGSQQGLEAVDYHLVCQVARTMKAIGVQRLAVVSSYGAHPRSRSYYLRCKGKMEEAIRQMGFEHVTFVRPGPLVGNRNTVRPDEIWLQRIMKVGQYLLWGKLKNLIPIRAEVVAQALLYSLFDRNAPAVSVLYTTDMKRMLQKYH